MIRGNRRQIRVHQEDEAAGEAMKYQEDEGGQEDRRAIRRRRSNVQKKEIEKRNKRGRRLRRRGCDIAFQRCYKEGMN